MSSTMPIEIVGVNAALKANSKARSKDAINIAEGLEKCANTLLKASQPLVPVDKGLLKASGHVEVTGKGMAAQALVVYDAPYAFVVHERLDVHHEPPTQARYLADAIPKVRGSMTALLKRQMLAGVHGGLG